MAPARPHRRRLLGLAPIDRFANINTTVIGDHREPKVRLPGAGGAPEIAAAGELTSTAGHPGVTIDQERAMIGWQLRVADDPAVTAPPAKAELTTLRRLQVAFPGA